MDKMDYLMAENNIDNNNKESQKGQVTHTHKYLKREKKVLNAFLPLGITSFAQSKLVWMKKKFDHIKI